MRALFQILTLCVLITAARTFAADQTPETFAGTLRQALDSTDAEQLIRLANWKGLNEMSIPFNRVRFGTIKNKFLQKEYSITLRLRRPDEPTKVEKDLFRKTIRITPTHVITIHVLHDDKKNDINLPIAKVDGQFLICCEQIILKRKIKPGDFSNPSVEAIPRN